jgi:hypothetical protein
VGNFSRENYPARALSEYNHSLTEGWLRTTILISYELRLLSSLRLFSPLYLIAQKSMSLFLSRLSYRSIHLSLSLPPLSPLEFADFPKNRVCLRRGSTSSGRYLSLPV